MGDDKMHELVESIPAIVKKYDDDELAERTGIVQTEISKLENGTRNPSIKLLQRLAEGMDMVLNISFTPKTSVRK